MLHNEVWQAMLLALLFTPALREPSARERCHPEAVLHKVRQSGACQGTGWLDDAAPAILAGIAEEGKFTFINAGANKGYELVQVLQRFGNASITESSWHSELLSYLRALGENHHVGHYSAKGAANPCGVCGACREHTAALASARVDATLFELNPATAEWLQHAVARFMPLGHTQHNVQLVNAAVGNVTGGWVAVGTRGAVGDERSKALKQQPQPPASSHGAATEVPRLPVVALDDYLDKRAVHRVHYLSIDTEGSDMLVLSGLQRSLARGAVDVLEFEVSPAPMNEFKMRLRELHSWGYACWWMGGALSMTTGPGAVGRKRMDSQLLRTGCLSPATGACWRDSFLIPQKHGFSNMLCARSDEVRARLAQRADTCLDLFR